MRHFALLLFTVFTKATFLIQLNKRLLNCYSAGELSTCDSLDWQNDGEANLLSLQVKEGNPSPCHGDETILLCGLFTSLYLKQDGEFRIHSKIKEMLIQSSPEQKQKAIWDKRHLSCG